MEDIVEFRGSYQYPTIELLDIALREARLHLESPGCGAPLGWRECFSADGTTLYVHATVPAPANAYFMSSVLRALAQTAQQGAIEARTEGTPKEYFFVESIARRDDFGEF